MQRTLGFFLAFAGFSSSASAGGQMTGALNVGITIQSSCEVGGQPVAGGYQVDDHNCVGAGRFRLLQQTDGTRGALVLQAQSTLTLAADKTPTLLTFYW
jgi:hypothetical protein